MSELINHTTASAMASVYAKNSQAILAKLQEIAELRSQLREVFFEVGAFDFEIQSY